jgi:hypothetical protein
MAAKHPDPKRDCMTTYTLYFLRRESDGAVKIGITMSLR